LAAPVYQLAGTALDGGWIITDPVGWSLDASGEFIKPPDDVGSGGNFSAGYTVKRGTQTAFLKAIDLSRAMRAPPGRNAQRVEKDYRHRHF
jgi:hypothetical protein